MSFICCKGSEWRPSRFKLSFWWVAKTWWSASNGFWTAGDLICEDMISTTGPFIAPSRACLTVRFTFFLRYEIEIQLILSLHPFCPSSCWDRWHNGDFPLVRSKSQSMWVKRVKRVTSENFWPTLKPYRPLPKIPVRILLNAAPVLSATVSVPTSRTVHYQIIPTLIETLPTRSKPSSRTRSNKLNHREDTQSNNVDDLPPQCHCWSIFLLQYHTEFVSILESAAAPSRNFALTPSAICVCRSAIVLSCILCATASLYHYHHHHSYTPYKHPSFE